MRSDEEIGEIDVGGGVEEAGDFVTAGVHAEAGEEPAERVLGAAAVEGEGVGVEGVVAGLGEVAVAHEL